MRHRPAAFAEALRPPRAASMRRRPAAFAEALSPPQAAVICGSTSGVARRGFSQTHQQHHGVRVAHMINAFRDHGHSITQLDPLGIDICPPSDVPDDLLLASYGFTESQLDEPVGLTGEDAMAHRAGYVSAQHTPLSCVPASKHAIEPTGLIAHACSVH